MVLLTVQLQTYKRQYTEARRDLQRGGYRVHTGLLQREKRNLDDAAGGEGLGVMSESQ